jgi:hypothetical protein
VFCTRPQAAIAPLFIRDFMTVVLLHSIMFSVEFDLFAGSKSDAGRGHQKLTANGSTYAARH